VTYAVVIRDRRREERDQGGEGIRKGSRRGLWNQVGMGGIGEGIEEGSRREGIREGSGRELVLVWSLNLYRC
jgi:hypothetical protein